jgi:RecJ-like exonuclease
MQTRPIHKILEYSTDPYIPDVTGSESGAIHFLHQIGIHPKNGKGWKKMIHLSSEDTKKLCTGIIMKRLDETNPEDIFGNIYTLPREKKGSPFRDAKEFSTLLNACGRLNKPSLGIGVCLGDGKLKKKALHHMTLYKKEIIKTLKWYEANKDSVIRGRGFVIINAETNVISTMIGTLASILSKSGEFPKQTYILSMARAEKNNTKVSLRVASCDKNVDLKALMLQITDQVNGAEAGGHKEAAGAVIPSEEEKNFLAAARSVLSQ